MSKDKHAKLDTRLPNVSYNESHNLKNGYSIDEQATIINQLAQPLYTTHDPINWNHG